MMRPRPSLRICLSITAAVALSLCPLAANAQAPALYTLDGDLSFRATGCVGPSPCLCPVFIYGHLEGTYSLLFTGTSGSFDLYAVEGVDWMVTDLNGTVTPVIGEGTYQVDVAGGEQQMTLTLTIDDPGGPVTQVFESGLVPEGGSFPDQIAIGVWFQVNVCIYDGFSLIADREIGPPALQFVRGDCNADGDVQIADAVFILTALFGVGATVPCADACDGNDDGHLDISDAIRVLVHLFLPGSPPPPPPFPGCGEDPTLDPLDCGDHPPCN
ncbi:MAG: hypothetical protein ACE5GW_09760 [Planctomycetota bacterium]